MILLLSTCGRVPNTSEISMRVLLSNCFATLGETDSENLCVSDISTLTALRKNIFCRQQVFSL